MELGKGREDYHPHLSPFDFAGQASPVGKGVVMACGVTFVREDNANYGTRLDGEEK